MSARVLLLLYGTNQLAYVFWSRLALRTWSAWANETARRDMLRDQKPQPRDRAQSAVLWRSTGSLACQHWGLLASTSPPRFEGVAICREYAQLKRSLQSSKPLENLLCRFTISDLLKLVNYASAARHQLLNCCCYCHRRNPYSMWSFVLGLL